MASETSLTSEGLPQDGARGVVGASVDPGPLMGVVEKHAVATGGSGHRRGCCNQNCRGRKDH